MLILILAFNSRILMSFMKTEERWIVYHISSKYIQVYLEVVP